MVLNEKDWRALEADWENRYIENYKQYFGKKSPWEESVSKYSAQKGGHI